MGARTKLNECHLVGSVGVAAVLGIVTGSWLVFVVAGASLVASSWYVGDIRLTGRKQK